MAKKTNNGEEKPKSNRGGKRTGAGRKPTEKLLGIKPEATTEIKNEPPVHEVPKPPAESKPELKPIQLDFSVPDKLPVDEKERGVIILALGHPNYGEMAFNLCASIKASNRDMPVHLVHHGNSLNHLNEAQKSLFDSMAVCPDEAIVKNGKLAYFKAKTHLYELSPFRETLYLDADTIWLYQKSIISFISELSDVTDFTMQNRGVMKGKYMWANPEDIYAKYPGKQLIELNSELIYFKKTEDVKIFFEKAKELFMNPGIAASLFAGDIADELPFAMAMMELDYYPHQSPYVPVFWFLADGRQGTSIQYALTHGYYAYSVGGHRTTEDVSNRYNSLARAAVSIVGITPAFRVKPKRRYLQERVKM